MRVNRGSAKKATNLEKYDDLMLHWASSNQQLLEHLNTVVLYKGAAHATWD